jgi:methionine-gamma-lyase
MPSTAFDPLQALAETRHEFGEHGGVNMSVETSATFTVMHPETMPEIFRGALGPDQGGCYLYGRHFNPTVSVLGRQLAAIEGTEAGYCTASGMAAIAATLTQLCDSGDRIAASNTIYGGTYALLKDYLPAKARVETDFVDVSDLDAVAAALRKGAKVLYLETMANPTLHVAHIPELAALAHDHGAKLVVDNTFCPLVVAPARLGADIVVHSLTKFINGTADVIAGAICADAEFITELMDLHTGSLMLLGPTMDPRAAFQISMRLPHLGLRMREHGRRAMLFAERLADRGYRVIYPGLASHPGREVFDSIRTAGYGHGGVFCLDLGTGQRAQAFMEALQNDEHFGFIAVSLGYFDTLMSLSAGSTSSEMGAEALAAAGISPGLVRISIGYTGALEQRWQQFAKALEGLEVAA